MEQARRARPLTAGFGLLPWIPLLLTACGGQEGGDAGATATRVPVTVTAVRQDTISETITVVGRLVPTPGSVATLSAPTAGIVRTVRVQVGERVAPAAVLLEIDAPELEANAAALEATAQAAERDASRQEALLADGIAARKDVEEKRAAATSARAAADAAHRLLAQTIVRSPIAGGVQRVLVNPGERVDAGAPLAEVVRGGPLDLVATVPQDRLLRLRVGQPAEIREEGAATTVVGVVHAIAPAVDSISNAGTAVIRVPRPDSTLRPGAGATAQVTTGIRAGVLIVPESALVLVGDSLAVFVIGPDSVAHRRAVTVGMRSGGRAQVEGDVHPGDHVAAAGAYGLVEGMRVVPAPAEGK